MKNPNDPKSEELKKQGCLNRRADQVKSALFQQSDFFDPRDLLQVKYEMLRQAIVEGQPIQRVVLQFGFSRPSFYQTLANFKQNGLLGLVRNKPGPRRAHKLSEPVVKFIEEQKAQDAALTLDKLVKRIKKKFGLVVHKRSIQRALTRKKKKSYRKSNLQKGLS
ncbi:MAG: helix-turn-helix domain-containing protein [Deltaproteobacteria bacterium]|nr:helix-turn-helix domain-containing protein [Deltaproteobacteria bacterium]